MALAARLGVARRLAHRGAGNVTPSSVAWRTFSSASPASNAQPRESPFVKGYMLREQTPAQVYSNLVHLCANGRTTRANELHKLLDRVESERDFQYALDGLALCRTRLVRFVPATTAKLIKAAQRAGCEDRVLPVLAESLKYRLFPQPGSFARLAVHYGLAGDGEKVKECQEALGAAGLDMHHRAAGAFVKAFVDAQDLDGALDVFETALAGGVTPKPHYVTKIVAAGSPLATSTEQVDRLSVILGSDAYAAIADQDSLSSVLDAARESVAASEAAESEGEGEGEGEEEAEA